MNVSRTLCNGVVSVAIAVGGLGLSACGDDSADAEPASQEAIQQDVNEAFDAEQGEQAKKRFEKQAKEAEQDVQDALEDAQQQADSDLESPSY